MSKMSDLANQFYSLRTEKDKLALSIKELQKKLDSTEEELLQEMAHEGLNRIDVKGKGSFFTSTRRFYKIADREALIDFIHEQGDTDLLTVNHQTLNGYAKEMHARKNAEGIEDYQIPGVEWTEKLSIKLKKAGSDNDSESDED